MAEAKDPNIHHPALPTQLPSTNRMREVVRPEGVQRLSVFTCFATAANYSLYFSGRVPIEGLAERIDRSVDRIVRAGNYRNRDFLSSIDVANYLVQDHQVPLVSLMMEDGRMPPTWRNQLSQWLKAGGTAIVASGGHARTLVEDPKTADIVLVDPMSASRRAINLTELPDDAFANSFLVPPKPEDASVEMIAYLRNFHGRVADALKKDREQATPNEIISITLDDINSSKQGKSHVAENNFYRTVPALANPALVESMRLLERDYLHREGIIRIKESDVGGGRRIAWDNLPTISIEDQGGKPEIIIHATNQPDIVITDEDIPPKQPEIVITEKDLPPDITITAEEIKPAHTPGIVITAQDVAPKPTVQITEEDL